MNGRPSLGGKEEEGTPTGCRRETAKSDQGMENYHADCAFNYSLFLFGPLNCFRQQTSQLCAPTTLKQQWIIADANDFPKVIFSLEIVSGMEIL
jgi:hypothetical protein